jgi:hypothetical protein
MTVRALGPVFRKTAPRARTSGGPSVACHIASPTRPAPARRSTRAQAAVRGRGQTGDTCLSTLGSLPVSSRSSTRLDAAFGDGNHAVDDILVDQARRDKVAQLERAPVGSCLTGHLTRQTSSRAAQTTRRSGALALLSARRATCARDAVPARAVSDWGVANRCFRTANCRVIILGELVGNPGLTTALPPPLPNTRVPWLTAPRRHHHPWPPSWTSSWQVSCRCPGWQVPRTYGSRWTPGTWPSRAPRARRRTPQVPCLQP